MLYTTVTVKYGGKDGDSIEKLEIPANFPVIWGEISRGRPYVRK